MSTSAGRQTVTGSKRRRTRRACEVCRRAKVKCNGAYPCEHCITFEYVCQYTDKGKVASNSNLSGQSTGADTGRPDTGGVAFSADDILEGDRGTSLPLGEEGNGQEIVRQSPDEVVGDPDLEAFDFTKTRFVSSSSSVAFPRSLGQDLDGHFTPRLHSFGYNLGIRPEEPSAIRTDLRQITSNDDLRQYSDVCYSVLSPIFDIVKPEFLQRRTRDYFQRSAHGYFPQAQKQDHFGAVIAGMIALGSFFSLSAGHPRETELVEYAKRILDDPAAIRRPTIDLVIGWILRTLYLRATTRPNNAWLASCVTMNLAEATGLHSEASIRSLSTGRAGSTTGDSKPQAEFLRKIFWTAWSVHNITAFEYGRSYTVPLDITCARRENGRGKDGDAQIYFRLAHIVQTLNRPIGSSTYKDAQGLVSDGFLALANVVCTLPFTVLTKADLCFCFYRRLRQQRFNVNAAMVARIIKIGNDGLDAALQLAEKHLPWWNVLSTTFQYLCVLLAIDTSASIKHVARAYSALEKVAENFDTHMTREALTTGRKLVDASIAKRKEEIALMDVIHPMNQRSDRSFAPVSDFFGEANLDVSIDWDGVFRDMFNENSSDCALNFGSTARVA